METLLLPGLDGTGKLFIELQRHLSSKLQVSAVSYPRTLAVPYDTMARDMKAPPGPFVLIAESFSGPLAILIASLRPQQVRALVLAATFVRNPAPVAARLGGLVGSMLFAFRPSRFLLRSLLLGADARDGLVDELAETVNSVDAGVLAARLRQIASADVSDAFRSLPMPILFLAATRDRLVRPARVRELLELRPALQIEWIEGPHLILQTRPREAAAAINRFLAPLI
jgi:pimeloyl-ACP methyl ester carboxylesterase